MPVVGDHVDQRSHRVHGTVGDTHFGGKPAARGKVGDA